MGRNVTVLTSGQLVTWSMTLLWTLVVPRALGPASMGVMVSGWAVAGILGVVLGLGTRNYLVREMVVNPSSAGQLIGTAMMLRLLLAPIFITAVILVSRYTHYSADGTLVLYLAAGANFFVLLAEPMQAGFQSVERMEYIALSEVISKSAQGLLGIGLALLGFRAVGITGCWLVVSVIVVATNLLWLRSFIRIDIRTSLRRLTRMVQQSLAYWAFGMFMVIYMWIDSAMLSVMTRPEVVGWYGVPMRLFQTLMFLPMTISTAWLPRLVSAHHESTHELRRAARMPVEVVIAVSLPMAAATAAAAPTIIHLLYGSAYDKSVPVMVVLGLCIPPMYLNIILSTVVIAASRQAHWTWVMAGATVVNPVLNAGLIRLTEDRYANGAIGAAGALLITELLIAVVGIVIVGRATIDRTILRRCLLSAAASLAMWAVAYATRSAVGIVSLSAAGITFVLLALLLRLVTPGELRLVRRLATARLRKVAGLRDRPRPADAR